MPTFDWKEKRVFITGASSGIGRSLAVELCRRGATLGLLARRREELEAVLAEIGREGGRAFAFPADVCERQAVESAVRDFRERAGVIDILVANAGVGGPTPASNFNADEVTRIININLVGVVNSVSSVLPEMIERRSGHLVAISSLAAYRGLPKSGAYCASKAGLTALFESLRLELRPEGIHVTTIHPGFIKTPLTSSRGSAMPFLMELDEATEKIIRIIEKRPRARAFPWQLASLVRLLKFAPNSLYDRIMANKTFRE